MIECFMFWSRQCDEIHTIMGKKWYVLHFETKFTYGPPMYVELFSTETLLLLNNRLGEDNDIQQRHFGNTELIYKCKKWWWDEYKSVALYSVPQKINSVCTKNMHVTM